MSAILCHCRVLRITLFCLKTVPNTLLCFNLKGIVAGYSYAVWRVQCIILWQSKLLWYTISGNGQTNVFRLFILFHKKTCINKSALVPSTAWPQTCNHAIDRFMTELSYPYLHLTSTRTADWTDDHERCLHKTSFECAPCHRIHFTWEVPCLMLMHTGFQNARFYTGALTKIKYDNKAFLVQRYLPIRNTHANIFFV